MGTVMGVFFPCIQNIFGVLFFIRMTWIVGTAGIVQSFFVVLTCVSVLYILPEGKVFESIYNNFRIYGSGLLFLVGMIVLAGVKVVNKFALPLVFVVLLCIFSSFLGAFVRFNGSDNLKFCMMGDRPVDVTSYYEATRLRPNCTTEGLRPLFCSDNGTCDPYYDRVKNVKVWRGSNLPAIRLEVCLSLITWVIPQDLQHAF
ncbi:unnamed protein product [Heligmosomoides polygyrus]|uniref:Tetraspanin n=1 Tax=Heligmosomoides polygyrus TaxID=6339 RepID=A0A183G8J9_HELPZ|nr:unnamed protein product [Heligmosomoides polygyrus]